MKKNRIAGCLILLLVGFANFGISQINTEEYLTPLEIFDKAAEYYQNEEYDKALTTFLEVHYNDTAYFDSRSKALQCASAQEKYDTVIDICKEMLAVKKYNPMRETFMNSMGHALLQQEKNQEALDYLDGALKEFPKSYLLSYNRASALYEMEKYTECIEELQMTIRYNPRYYASHFKLGLICAQAGDLTKAALSMNMGLFLISTEDKAVNLISGLEAIYTGELGKEKIEVKYREEEDFDEIDLMLKNKVAENSKYKVKVKLPYNFIKHNHLIFETMEYDPELDAFWNQTYIRYFKEIYNKGEFANYSYLQSYKIDNPKTQAVIAKNISKLKTFITWAADRLTICMNERRVWDGEKYIDNNLKHIGAYGFNEEVQKKNDIMVGPYKSFSSSGLVKSSGNIDDKGKVEGVWKYYNDDGILTTEANFIEGKIEGKHSTFYVNGSRRKVYDIKDDKLDSDIFSYYSFNQLYSKVPYDEDGEKHGDAEYYFKKGGVSHKITYDHGKINGDYIEYYSDGQLKVKVSYVNGKEEGKYLYYHENGKLNTEGFYENGMAVGHWKYMHDNGVLKEEGDLKSDFRIGIWQTFTENGKLSEETNYGETGKKTGIYKEFSLDGNLILELTYKGEEIISYVTYNSKGEVVSQKEKKKKELEFVDYYDNGKKRLEGNYYKGKYIGTWKYYNQYGTLTKELVYNDEGNLEGTCKWYFDNGQIETLKIFKDGVIDGYFVDYYRKGNIFKHGWVKDGESVGLWEYFYRNGTLKSTKYFIEGEQHGDVVYYNEKGKLSEITHYFYGNYEGVSTYDTLGNESAYYPLVDGSAVSEYKDVNGKPTVTKTYKGTESNGERISYYGNGKIRSKGEVIDDNYAGNWKWYSREGQLTTEGSYILGRKEGEWKWYYDDGKLKLVKNYVKGNLEGTVVRYYENGKKTSEKKYRIDQRHGEFRYYDETGELLYIRYYNDGLMLGYSYYGKDGKLIEMIPFDNQNGKIEAFFSTGKKSYSSEYKDGYNHGKTIFYHSNGKESDVRNYEKNQFHGKHYEYYQDGTIKTDDDYVNGDLYGDSKTYYPNGKLKSVKRYILGELYGWAEYYNEKGSVSEKIYYYDGRQLN